MNLAKQLYEKKKMRLIIFGLIISFLGAIAVNIFMNFNVSATNIILENFPSTLLAAYVLSLLTLSLCEGAGGIMTMIFTTARGIPLAEYGRILGVKSSRTILISSILGGPIATACFVMAVSLCGSTYANCVVGMTPILTAIFGILFLKERANKRIWCGIIICSAGIVIAAMGPPEGVTNFYLGIAIACIAPFAYTAENIISTHAMDVSDPTIACPLYRMLGSAVMEFVIAIVVCAATGHTEWIGYVFSTVFSSPLCIMFILLAGLFMAVQYNGTYASFIYVGAMKSSAILWTCTFWSIPIGYTMGAMGILEYSITGFGVIGAIAVVIGVMLVVAKPKELFNLRAID